MPPSNDEPSPNKPPLLDQLRTAIRTRHYSIRTEQAYVHWVRRFIQFHRLKYPIDLGATGVAKFLTWLAVEQKVLASTQNQALNALVFLYRVVLKQPLQISDQVVRARRSTNLPVVLTEREAEAVLAQLSGIQFLMLSMLYGSGLRLLECVRLRVKDLDFQYRCVNVRGGKGNKDRVVTLADPLVAPLKNHVQTVKLQWRSDEAAGHGSVWLP